MKPTVAALNRKAWSLFLLAAVLAALWIGLNLLALFVLTRSKAVASLLDAPPASWLVGIQVYRILGGMFLVYWIHGTIPGAFALPAGIGDVATGLLALPGAMWVASGSLIGRKI